MTHALAIAARELRERWILFPAALAFGFLPLVLSAFGPEFRDIAPVVGFALAVVLGAAAAVVVGAAMLARDGATGRLGFLLSRPVSSGAIWTGKWAAALVLVFGSGLLASLPWMAFLPPPEAYGGSWVRALLNGPGVALFAALAVLAVGLANFNATVYRSRSAWLVVDLVLLVAATWAARAYVAHLYWYGFVNGRLALHLLAAVLALALVVGSAGQLFLGRTDLRRAHLALSIGSWAVVWTGLAAAAAVVFWVRAATPRDVRAHAMTRDPSGRWAYVEGAARVPVHYYTSAYLIDTATGRFRRTADERPFLQPRGGVAFSRDGRLAVRPVPSRDGRETALEVLELGGERPGARTVRLENSPLVEPWSSMLLLSPSARLVLLAHVDGASLFDVATGRRVATATAPPGFRPATCRFTGERAARVWLVPRAETAAEMRILDVSEGASAVVRAVATTVPVPWWGGVRADATGSRIVTLDGALRLRDGADGHLIATVVESAFGKVPSGAGMLAAAFLADGRLVTADGTSLVDGTKPRVSVFDADGRKLHEAGVEMQRTGLVVGPELPGSRVLLAASRGPVPEHDSLVFDANEGKVTSRLTGLRALHAFEEGGMASIVPPGAVPSPVHFFVDRDGQVVRLDTSTGERKAVTGPGASAGERLRWK